MPFELCTTERRDENAAKVGASSAIAELWRGILAVDVKERMKARDWKCSLLRVTENDSACEYVLLLQEGLIWI